MDNVVRILIAEDLPSDADLAKREITAALSSCTFEVVETPKEYLEAIKRFQPHLIISDYKMPHFDGFTAMRLAQQHAPTVPFIIVTGSMNEETAVECMKAGATDYVIKEHIKRLGLAVVSALEQKRLRLEKERTEAEERAAQNAVRESEERYRSLFDGVPIALYRTTPEGQIIDANPTLLEMLGYPDRQSLLVTNVGDTYANQEQRIYWSTLIEKEGVVKSFEKQLCRRDGKVIWVEENSRAVRDAEGRLLYYEGSFQDITERKKAEQEMMALQEQLRQSQKMEAIGRLAGGIAHDFNNLLTIIKGYSQLSLLELKKSDPIRGNLEEVRKASDRASDLIRQLLAFSRRQILDMMVLDLNMVMGDLDKMLRRVIGEDIELVTLLAEDLGRVKTDPGQMQQVIMNLAVNAKDAMPNGGKLTIETANVELDEAYARAHVAVTPGRYVMLSASDTGVGMSAEVRDQIFEPFFTTKEKGKGTGLGLSTVYGIVKQSGGNIWVYSEPGKGTTFKIYLPRVDEPPEEFREKVEVKEIPRGTETILLVEDEKEVLKLASRILKKQGYRILEAATGEEALKICKENREPFHLLLTDVVMPQMSGRQLKDELEQVCEGFKILYMSGYTDNAIVHHGVLEKGMNFIQKPFTLEGLARKVREVLDQ